MKTRIGSMIGDYTEIGSVTHTPYAGQLSYTTVTVLMLCRHCGAVTGDTKAHTEWHKAQQS